MRERGVLKQLEARQQEETKQKLGGIELPPDKLYMIDKVVRKKLQEHLQFNASELDPAANARYDPLESVPEPGAGGSRSGPAEPQKLEGAKGPETANGSREPESKDFNQKLMQKVEGHIEGEADSEAREQEHGLTYDEWLELKREGERLRQQLIESEMQEQRHAEEQRLQERQEQDQRR